VRPEGLGKFKKINNLPHRVSSTRPRTPLKRFHTHINKSSKTDNSFSKLIGPSHSDARQKNI
jgi:hypothetical protein